MSEIKTWANTVGQQIENMTVDLVAITAGNVSEAAGDVFFVGRPAQNGQDWILKKITPTELEKMVYSYLTSNAVAPLLAQVLGGFTRLAASDPSTPDTFDGIGALGKNVLMTVFTNVINTGKFQDMPIRTFGHLINLTLDNGCYIQFYVRDYYNVIYVKTHNANSAVEYPWMVITPESM